MDIRKIFEGMSDRLLGHFKTSSEIKNPGGKGETREDAFREFLDEYLPKRYAVGSGEVITSQNRVSPELDVVIYDPLHCPTLIKSTSHSVYPEESVYGAISVKSHLDSKELKEAYENIRELKSIISTGHFTHRPHSGMAVGFSSPIPLTGVVAYAANRSLEAIAEQTRALDDELPDVKLRPDFVAVIGQGIVGPRQPLRSEFNAFDLPMDRDDLVLLRKSGRHTLLRVYMQVLRELNALTLRPLELHRYDEMPRLIGEHRVGRHNYFVKFQKSVPESRHVIRFNLAAIREIISKSKPVSLKQHYLNYLGHVPAGLDVENADVVIYEYNPKNLPPITSADAGFEDERPLIFQPVFTTIDGIQYAVDIGSLSDEHFDANNDFTADELLSG